MESARPSARSQVYFYTSGVTAPELPTLFYTTMQPKRSTKDIEQRPDLYACPPNSEYVTYANPTGSDGVYYAEGPMMASESNLSSISMDSQQRRQRTNRIEEPSGYWVLPHTKHHKSSEPSSSTPTRYVTPGGRYLHRRPKKHTAGVQVRGPDYKVYPTVSPGGVVEESEEMQQYSSLSRKIDPNISVCHVPTCLQPLAYVHTS
ncbi:unnamed protein product [Dibothriocephalus latus]|uniref:Uncharacterized protein n=1 Tax=Dibothriocephalus latus TaxID=60516 RepID=A0A3P7RGY2_DIBLA|nr:unnamed protein product [Dibothriocephalus latus]